MQLPPDILTAGVEATTSATIGVNVTTAIVAAPGAGFRVRVWAWTVALDRQYNGPAFGVFVDSAGATNTGYFGLDAGGRGTSFQLPGGLAYPANRGISVTHRANAASQRLFCHVLYTVESI